MLAGLTVLKSSMKKALRLWYVVSTGIGTKKGVILFATKLVESKILITINPKNLTNAQSIYQKWQNKLGFLLLAMFIDMTIVYPVGRLIFSVIIVYAHAIKFLC